jgi:hypothetical protein
VAALLYGLRRTAIVAESALTPAPQPLDFELVVQRFDKIKTFPSRNEIEKLLGPPTWVTSSPKDWEVDIFAYSDFGIPKDRILLKWIDPNDDRKWVAVRCAEGKVYSKYKHGFPPNRLNEQTEWQKSPFPSTDVHTDLPDPSDP